MGAHETTSLVKYEAARRALAEAHRVDEVKQLRDKHEALAAYARQAKDTEMIQYATEMKVRAERRAGQLLAEMEKAKGTLKRGATLPRSHDATAEKQKTLAEMGISKDQSSRYQALAGMPDDAFETAIETAKETAGEVTSAHMRRLAAQIKKNHDLENQLAEARRNLDPVSKSNNAWGDIMLRMHNLHREVLSSFEMPPCTPETSATLFKQWRDISDFLSQYLEAEQ